MRFVFFIALSIMSVDGHAYPQFIGHGYTSCMTCHYNPLGNGPLTDYGRAVSATGIAGRVWYPKTTSEETIGKSSAFLFREWESNKYVRPSLNYRYLYLKRKVGTINSQTDRITMMLSGNVVIKNKDDSLFFVGEIGYAPEPEGGRSSLEKEDTYRSREHYVGWRIDKNWGLYAGMLDKAFGIRIDDHSAFSRSTTGLAQNDQAHGIMVHHVADKWDTGFHLFVGNLEQEDNIRQEGFSAITEYSLFPATRVGASFLRSESDFVENMNYAVHTRIGFGKGSSVMIELGQANRTAVEGSLEIKSRYYFMQNQISLLRGLYFNYALEWFIPDVDEDAKTLRLGPGLQWMPGQRLEFRFDLWNQRAFNPNGVARDSWDFAGQVHVWL